MIAQIAPKCPSGAQVRRISWETEGLGRSVTDFWPPQNRRWPATSRCLLSTIVCMRILGVSIPPRLCNVPLLLASLQFLTASLFGGCGREASPGGTDQVAVQVSLKVRFRALRNM